MSHKISDPTANHRRGASVRRKRTAVLMVRNQPEKFALTKKGRAVLRIYRGEALDIIALKLSVSLEELIQWKLEVDYNVAITVLGNTETSSNNDLR